MQIAANKLNLSINERNEIVEFLLMALSFDASIIFVFSLEKTKMWIGAQLADESETNKRDIVAGGEPQYFDERFIQLIEDKGWWVVHE